jgi:hypothetical protein
MVQRLRELDECIEAVTARDERYLKLNNGQ